MIDFQNIKFRASSWGNLLTEPQTKADKEAGRLSKSCIGELIKIYNMEVYGRKRDITTNKMIKGKAGEPESIKLFSVVDGEFYVKNELQFENDWFKGNPDIVHGISCWDIKTRWDLDSFMPKLIEDADKGEELQLQVYFDLTGTISGGIANTLIDCPIEILMDEKRKLLYSMNVISEESPEYVKAAAELEHLLTFPDIPPQERVIKQPVTRNDELIGKMKAKVPAMRQWLEEFHDKNKHKRNLYVTLTYYEKRSRT